jgi:hypothetical protein
MTQANRSLDGERARLALEQARLLVQYLEVDESPDYRFVRTHALTLLQLVDGFDGEGLPTEY